MRVAPRSRPRPASRVGGLAAGIAALAFALVVNAPSRSAAAPGAGDGAGQLFRADCSYCHGTAGQGTELAPTLRGVGRASVYFQLASGRMPLADARATPRRAAPAYSPATIAALVDEVARLTGDTGPTIPEVSPRADVAAGGELYRLDCAACHAWSGEGGALFEREAPSIHAASRIEVAAVIRAGSGNMPAFGQAALSDRQVADVVAYVNELDHSKDPGGNPLWHLGPFAEGLIALGVALPILLAATRWIGERS